VEALKQLFWSSRPISWVNTAYPFFVSYWLATGELSATLWIGTLFFLIPYNLLMYGINDVFDYESDLNNPRKGGIEGALLDPKWHRLTVRVSVLLCFPFVTYLTFAGTSTSTGWLYLVLFTVIAYSAKGLRFKERPFLDSLTSSSHFVGPMIFGLSLAGVNSWNSTLLTIVIAFTLWGVASHAFGAVQDVKADRIGGISSIATVIGARLTVRFAMASYLLAGLLLLTTQSLATWAAVAAIPYLIIVGQFWNITDETCEKANRGWKKFIWLNFFAGSIVSLLVIEFSKVG
jgi:4-hydroxybenzoate polyprenyltransferase